VEKISQTNVEKNCEVTPTTTLDKSEQFEHFQFIKMNNPCEKMNIINPKQKLSKRMYVFPCFIEMEGEKVQNI
jgi:hypothetical protein